MANNKKTAPDWKERIAAIVADASKGNTICADCKESEPDWSVWNHGCFVCIKCAGIHRQLGVHISKVKSIKFDQWSEEALQHVQKRGNNHLNNIYECRKPKFYISPSESSVEEVRRYFIRQKYETRAFTQEMKVDPGSFVMPQKVMIGMFLNEKNKKKVYLQILGEHLFYFRYNHDSYHFEKYKLVDIYVTIDRSQVNNSPDLILSIMLSSNKKSLFRLRNPKSNLKELITWVHVIRCGTLYYQSKYHKTYLQSMNHKKPPLPLKQLTEKELSSSKILGIASKKGGGAHSWRKRWWVLYNGSLYYFKDDFRKNKKSNGIGTPQGSIYLFEADIISDYDRQRTGKTNSFLICTPNRTFYVQPQQQNCSTFVKSVEQCCEQMTDRKPIDFVSGFV